MIWYKYILQNNYYNKRLTSIISHSYNFFFLVIRTEIYSVRNFQIYNRALLTVINMLYITSAGFICLTTGSFYRFTTHFSNPPPIPLTTTLCSLYLWFQFLLDSTYRWDHTVYVFLWLAYIIYNNALKVHLYYCKWQDFLPFYGWIMFHYMNRPYFVYNLILEHFDHPLKKLWIC